MNGGETENPDNKNGSYNEPAITEEKTGAQSNINASPSEYVNAPDTVPTEYSAEKTAQTGQQDDNTGKHNSPLTGIFQTAAGIAIGIGAGILIVQILTPALPELIFILLFIASSIFLNLNLYNLGQLITGCAFEGKLLLYQFVFLRFCRTGEKILRRITGSHLIKGQCSILPPSGGECPAPVYIAFFSGGICACIAAGVICVITGILLPADNSGIVLKTYGIEQFSVFLRINGIIAIIFAVIHLIPVFWENSPSDGRILFALLKKSSYTANLIKLRMIAVQLAAGIRPSDLSVPDIKPVSKKRNAENSHFIKSFYKIADRLIVFFKFLLFYDYKKGKTAVFSALKALAHSSDAAEAAEILDTQQTDGPEEEADGNTTRIPDRNDDTVTAADDEAAKPKKVTEYVEFPVPDDNSGKLAGCNIVIVLYNYYIALDNADRNEMYANIRLLEENTDRIPRQLFPKICRELCFYYSINRDNPQAEHYMELMNKKTINCIEEMRVRAYYEMYIKHRYKSAFSICRDALEKYAGKTANGLYLMNTDLIKGLVSYIHSKNASG